MKFSFLSILRQFANRYFTNLGYRSKKNAEAILAEFKSRQEGSCGLPADGGWAYLINDTNDFLSWQLGISSWDAWQIDRVGEIMTERRAYFDAMQVPYLMVVTPEKSVAYREWLPHELVHLPDSGARPALLLSNRFPDMVTYPLEYLESMKRQGHLYFRVDTHANWLGSYYLYRHTIEAMCARGNDIGTPIPISHMKISIASWLGDVLTQIPENLKAEFEADADNWRPMVLQESMLQINLHPDHKRAERLPEPDVFRTGRPERETVVTHSPDKTLPRAVIFRDSTASFMIDLLAEHFSRAVFIWHRDDVIGDVIEQEKPDVVLHLKAERFLSSYPITVPVSWDVRPR